MVREIVRPTSGNYVVHIPQEYINQEVEILVLPFTYPDKSKKNKIYKSLHGSLSQYANPTLIDQEKDIAWGRVAEDKNVVS